MKLTIEDLRGVWRAQVGSHTEFAETLEELLLKLAPAAPEAYVWHGAEVLGAILGAEVVELASQPREVPGEMYDTLSDFFTDAFGALDEPEYVDENWHPTDAQRAYFETHPNEFPKVEYDDGTPQPGDNTVLGV